MPNFSISLNSVLSTISSGNLLSFAASIIHPSYGIYHANINKSALDFYSVIKFDHSAEALITNAPVAAKEGEAGNYSSINKVIQPSKITMRVTLEGMTAFSGVVPRIPSVGISTSGISANYKSRTDIINKLEEMKNNADLYNIETPDRVYPNYDLINYQFVMSANSGVTLLIVDLTFQEIRTILETTLSNDTTKNATTKQAPAPIEDIS